MLFNSSGQMPAATEIDNVIRNIFDTTWAYPGCPTLTGDYWLNDQQFDQPTWVLLLASQGTEVSPSPTFAGVDWLKIDDLHSPLAIFPDADGYVASQKLLRCLNIYMSTLKGYQRSYINTSLIQVILSQGTCCLLPVVPVDNKLGERIYYLIADSNNNWKRLSPDVVEV